MMKFGPQPNPRLRAAALNNPAITYTRQGYFHNLYMGLQKFNITDQISIDFYKLYQYTQI